jgi:hypothetical protein
MLARSQRSSEGEAIKVHQDLKQRSTKQPTVDISESKKPEEIK